MMKIGGFLKNTFIDFPKTLSCLVFTQGCNFICPYCHNPLLVAGTPSGTGSLIPETEIFSFLENRKTLLEGVAITGGEPCLQKDIGSFCETVKQMGFKVKLDTNGSRPDVIKTLLADHLVDYIAMDIKTDTEHYHLAAGTRFDVLRILESISLIMSKAPLYEFRTTCAAPFISRDIMTRIGPMIKGATHYFLSPCSRNVDMLDPTFADNPDHFLSPEDLEDLKQAVDPFVEHCTIR